MSLKILFLFISIIISMAAMAQELSSKNIEKLSQMSDQQLFEALILTEYKQAALNRRDEIFVGVKPEVFSHHSKKILELMDDRALALKPLYERSIKAFKALPKALRNACEDAYDIRKKIPKVVKKVYFDSLGLKFSLTDQKLVRAQAWTRLQLLRNFYANSIASYKMGDVYSEIMGLTAKCHQNEELYQKLVFEESKLLSAIDQVLDKVIGQPGLQTGGFASKTIGEKYIHESSRSKLLTDAIIFAYDSVTVEVFIYFTGMTFFKYGVAAIRWTPKAYMYLYPILTGNSVISESKLKALEKLDPKGAAARNVALFGDRLYLYYPFGFQVEIDKLDVQTTFAMEMEKVVASERMSLREESIKLCKGSPCTQEQVDQLLEKFNRNKNEILHVMKLKNM